MKQQQTYDILNDANWHYWLSSIKVQHDEKLVFQNNIPTFYDKFLGSSINELLSLNREKPIADQLNELSVERQKRIRSAAESVTIYLNRYHRDRFVTFSSRLLSKEGPSELLFKNQEINHQGIRRAIQWKGIPLIKSAYDYCIYPILLWDLKPKSIFEIGSGSGSSALWMADLMKDYEYDCKIYSLDVNPVALKHESVEFIQKNAAEIPSLFSAEFLNSKEHPWLIVQDQHDHISLMLEHFELHAKKGDYFFIEDSTNYQNEIGDFILKKNNSLLVDTLYTDYFGRNATTAKNSILIKQ